MLVIKWTNPPGASGLEGLSELTAYARAANRFVIVGQRTIEVPDPDSPPYTMMTCEPAIWWSKNATSWHLAQLPDGYVDAAATEPDSRCSFRDVAAGGPGFVAAGTGGALWSIDGERWTVAVTPGVTVWTTLTDVGTTPAGMIAIGEGADGGFALQSTDGITWSALEGGPSLGYRHLQLVEGDGALIVFGAAEGPGDAFHTDIWRLPSPEKWSKLSTVNDSLSVATIGPLGWAAFGYRGAWLSSNGRTWTHVHGASPKHAAAAIGDEMGFVVTTDFEHMTGGCALARVDTGDTWTSVNGPDWHQMKATWNDRWIGALFVVGQRLIGVGQWNPESSQNFGFVRTAALGNFVAAPLSSVEAEPLVAPPPGSAPSKGC